MERRDTTDTPGLYTALSHAPVRAPPGNDVDLSIYRKAGETTYGVFKYEAPTEGLIQVRRGEGGHPG